jgi:flagellar basal body-associated protein FliL
MATKDGAGRITETEQEATQAEKSPDTLVILTVSLVASVVVAVALFWYFGLFSGWFGTPR